MKDLSTSLEMIDLNPVPFFRYPACTGRKHPCGGENRHCERKGYARENIHKLQR